MKHFEKLLVSALSGRRWIYLSLFAGPVVISLSVATTFFLLSDVHETTTGDEEIFFWGASIINPPDTITYDDCTQEVHDGSVTIKAPCSSVEPPAVGVSYEANGRAIGPINTALPPEPNIGWLTRNMDEAELRSMLDSRGYTGLSGMNASKLRQLMVVYEYEPFFWRMHERTGLPVSVIAGYFIVEATRQGVESSLLRLHYNPGGVKYRGVGQIAYYKDDCHDKYGNEIPCRFESLSSYEQMEDVWAGVFNNARYSRCKEYTTVEDICYCLYRAGYHSGGNWKLRANVAKRYWVYRSKFPRPDLMASNQ